MITEISPGINVLLGDWIERLRELPDESVHCIVTSPPYWQLRDYQVAGQLGMEKSPEEYVAKMVAGFREVYRVLRHDGTLWLNLGDTYAGGGLGGGGSFACDGPRMVAEPGSRKNNPGRKGSRLVANGLKTKDLVGMPWRVAFALQADGWYLRADNIWAKPNPMPESVLDRTTRSHEYLFLFSKRERYFYDAHAIKEGVTGNAHARGNGVNPKAKTPGSNSRIYRNRDPHHSPSLRPRQNESFSAAVAGLISSRNKRSVWFISPAPYRGAHFATFPPKLIEPCILAGTSEAGCCTICGAPYRRVLQKGKANFAQQLACGGDKNGKYNGHATKNFNGHKAQNASEVKARILNGLVERETSAWQTTCKHPISHPEPCVVLDPFGGSGTVAQVCRQHGRRAILIDLNPNYLPLMRERIEKPYGQTHQNRMVR